MSPPDPARASPSPDGAAAPTSLGDRAASGLAWMVIRTVGGKGVRIATLLILGAILQPDAFGLFATTASITAFAGLIQDAGVRDILIQRHRHFERWATAGFWLSLMMGLSIGILVAALAWPIANFWFRKPEVAGLLLVASLNFPVSALGSVAMARLNANLQFKYLVMVSFAEVLCLSSLTVAIAFVTTNVPALEPYTAYSFVIPWPIASGLRAYLFWRKVRVRIRPTLHLRRWKYLLGDSFYVTGASIGGVLFAQAPFLIMGRLMDETSVGYYYFAYRLAAQTVSLFGNNLRSILFPTLSQLLHAPRRQTDAFIRAIRLLGHIIVPICAVQAALIGPILRLLWGDEWMESTFVAQVLSCTVAFTVMGFSASSLIQAQGRFGTRFVIGWTGGLCMTVAAAISASVGTIETVAIAVGVTNVAYAVGSLVVAISRGGGRVSSLVSVFAPPILISSAAAAAGWGLGQLVPPTGGLRFTALLQAAVIGTSAFGLVLLLGRVFVPGIQAEIWNRIGRLLVRRRHRSTARASEAAELRRRSEDPDAVDASPAP